ncbi:MAG: iron-containing alcohol dehydrogenase, class IV [Candidatus Fermentimicrarchaeum limneticum]|uniref:Iron-containing alcohol dehydrogenase, class IV n=1 Tax=Fermentimicrarchaeum limneticum TaxID=2795018 RepID=A0A7D5XC10_FERL1|nr:MAG: iron-containing alcohol dehydrogenase, class IV [Candidatus Fermentimicrarchaeum limneticum]
MWEFQLPTKIIFGRGSIDRVWENVDKKKVLLVTGKSGFREQTARKIRKQLGSAEIAVYDKVEPNPTYQNVDEGVELVSDARSQMIIALGGGSVIDAAKLIALLAVNEGDAYDYAFRGKKIERKGLPLLAIPTTAGTGSEVTPFAVISDKEKKLKAPVRNRYLFPKVAVVDPQLTASMPKELTANTGADALAHALEALWSKKAGPITDYLALRAVKIIFENLKKACDEPQNIEVREEMSLASLLGGMAISNAWTGPAHAISYPFTTHFGVAHGNACSLTLPEVMEFNALKSEKINRITQLYGPEKLRELFKGVGLKTKLSEVGVKKEDIPVILEGVVASTLETNMVKMEKGDIEALLNKIL